MTGTLPTPEPRGAAAAPVGFPEATPVIRTATDANSASAPRVRIGVLDSLRGIAALSVLLFHALSFIPELAPTLEVMRPAFLVEPSLKTFLLTLTPLSLLWKGLEPVILFFVLSGFVLSLPYHRNNAPSYLAFVIRRACRLLLPCAVSVLAAALAVELVGQYHAQGIYARFNAIWDEPVTSSVLLRHLLLLEPENYPLNTSIWTLYHEWRVSLIFPLLILLVRTGTGPAAAVSLFGVGLAIAERKLLGSHHLGSLYFLPYFVLGVVLASRRHAVIERIKASSSWGRAGLWFICFLLLVVRPLLPFIETFENLAVGFGTALLIALILGSPTAQALLERPALTWLGRVSFSLYLVHIPLLLTGIRVLPEAMPLPARLTLLVLLSLALSELMYRAVERPSMQLGRRLTAALERRSRPATFVAARGA